MPSAPGRNVVKRDGQAGMLQFKGILKELLSVDVIEQIRRHQLVVQQWSRMRSVVFHSASSVLVQDHIVVKTANAAENMNVKVKTGQVVQQADDQSQAQFRFHSFHGFLHAT